MQWRISSPTMTTATTMDIVSDIMIFISFAMLAYMAFQYVAEKVEHVKQIFNEATVNTKAKFDGSRDEQIEDDNQKFDDFIEHADDTVEA